MNSTELSCREFVAVLASDAPAPGGGGAAALGGAIGMALTNMVGSLTAGKPKFAAVEDEIVALKEQANTIQDRFLQLVVADAEVFEPLSRAYGLPKTTEEEAAYKVQVMEECLVSCAEVPLAMMQCCYDALLITERMEQIGTPIAISDVGCAAAGLKAALMMADLNVRVNTKLMVERSKADELNVEAESLLQKGLPLADRLYQKVQSRYS